MAQKFKRLRSNQALNYFDLRPRQEAVRAIHHFQVFVVAIATLTVAGRIQPMGHLPSSTAPFEEYRVTYYSTQLQIYWVPSNFFSTSPITISVTFSVENKKA